MKPTLVKSPGEVAPGAPSGASPSPALETFTGCGARFEAGRTHVDLAALREPRGDGDAARKHLVLALAIFEAANAPKRAEAARDLARSLGIALAES